MIDTVTVIKPGAAGIMAFFLANPTSHVGSVFLQRCRRSDCGSYGLLEGMYVRN